MKWEDTGELATDDRIHKMVDQIAQTNPPLEVISSTQVVIKMRAYGEEIRALKAWQESGTCLWRITNGQWIKSQRNHQTIDTVATEKLQVQTDV